MDYSLLLNNNNTEGFTTHYMRSIQKTEYYGTIFAQDIEPHGEYMCDDVFKGESGFTLPNNEYGIIHFSKPLFIEFISTTHGGWKTKLSQRYNGKTGRALTQAIVKDGYDGIVTIDSKDNELMEIVNISGNKEVHRIVTQ